MPKKKTPASKAAKGKVAAKKVEEKVIEETQENGSDTQIEEKDDKNQVELPKKRGRPKNVPVKETPVEPEEEQPEVEVKEKETKKKLRGRAPKKAKEELLPPEEEEKEDEPVEEQAEELPEEPVPKRGRKRAASKDVKPAAPKPEKPKRGQSKVPKKEKSQAAATKESGRGKKASKNENEDMETNNDVEETAKKPGKGKRKKEAEEEETTTNGKAESKEKSKTKKNGVTPHENDPETHDDDEDDEEELEEVKPKGRKKRMVKATDKEPEVKVPKNSTITNWSSIDFNCKKENKKSQHPNLKITSWNVDGLRAWIKKDGLAIIEYEKPDIFCIQEIKCPEDKVPDEIKNYNGYHSYWCCSNKEGYAGVALLTKIMPIEVKYGIDNEDHDTEGRCIIAEYEKFYLVNVYVPNAGRKLVTLPKRLDWNELFKKYIKRLEEKKPVIICGDMNVAHNEIDIANPKGNTKNAGFTKEEREGMTDFLNQGFVDSFRHLYPNETAAYTFWSYMQNARTKNIGWRLDYFILSKKLIDNVCDNVIRKDVLGSDHCPITLFINV